MPHILNMFALRSAQNPMATAAIAILLWVGVTIQKEEGTTAPAVA